MWALLIFLATICVFLTGSWAVADPLYNTIDLGAGYTLSAKPDKSIYSVTGADGVTYAFDKSPITYIGNPEHHTMPVGHEDMFWAYTITDGIHQVGYVYDTTEAGRAYYSSPTIENAGQAWALPGDQSPALDFNIHGQVVGRSGNMDNDGNVDNVSHAAFSDLDFKSHNDFSKGIFRADNLNDYITPIPEVSLTSALKIDDAGRILAQGSNGDSYLLTPVELGLPSPIPEPGSIAIFGLAILALGVRSARGRPR